MEGFGSERKGRGKKIRDIVVHVPTAHNKCNHQALQIWANRNQKMISSGIKNNKCLHK